MKQLTFRLEERGKPDQFGKVAVMLIDSEGFVCGVFSSEEEAKKATPSILHNIQQGKVNMKYGNLKHMRPQVYEQLQRNNDRNSRYRK